MSNEITADKAADNLKNRYTPGTVYKIVVAMVFLLAFGLVMIFSASSYSSAEANFMSQLKHIGIGTVLMCAAVYIPYGVFRKLVWVEYMLSSAVILALLTPFGLEDNGATRWLGIPGTGLSFQAADVVRILLILFIAGFISSKWKEMNDWRTVIVLWLLVGLQAGMLLVISTNLSSCIVILGICYCSTFIASRNWKLHVGVLLIAVVAAAVYVLTLVQHLPTEAEMAADDNFRNKRIYGWLYTEKYKQSAGYQVIQSLYAIGSGSLKGKGLGNGTQKLSAIPEAQNDMIFAIICEELGIVGVVMLFLLYGYLLYQMYMIVKESRDVFGTMVVIGVMVHLTCQVVINVCVATNLFPNTGVALPFISSGGTAIMATMVECGLCIGIRRQQTRRMYQKYLNDM